VSAVSVRPYPNPVRTLLVWAIRGYQAFISPALPRRCKYYPSCSQYALDALKEFGVARGLVLAGWRLLRCNPMSYGGYDPVERQRLFAPRGQMGRRDHCCAEDPSGLPRDTRSTHRRDVSPVSTGI